MKWGNLLSQKRNEGKRNADVTAYRSDFERDYDRVVFSSAFRRLQDKTQVIPLPESDFVHSRLTHSLETACVGRSLGKIVGAEIIKRLPELKTDYSASDFGAIVAAACLAHDIGNPPFGHSGEKAISEYFLNGEGKKYRNSITDDKKWNDLVSFEGNANGFRVLTNASNSVTGGIRLTYATLATFAKYPKESLPVIENSKRASEKKYSFFQSEKEQFKDVAETVGLIPVENEFQWRRHPLSLLVEAADDICYRIIDFEDGLRLGLINPELAEELLLPICMETKMSSYNEISNFTEKIGYLRAVTINTLTDDLSNIFLNNEEAILKGDYDRSLIKDSKHIDSISRIHKISVEKVYNSQKVLEIEAAGFEVIAGLLDAFLNAVNDKAEGKKSYRSEKYLQLIPLQFLGEDGKPDEDVYLRILKICEFVAGMTDSYAISIFRKIKGIELPK